MKTKFVFITYATPTKFSKISGVDHLSQLLEIVWKVFHISSVHLHM